VTSQDMQTAAFNCDEHLNLHRMYEEELRMIHVNAGTHSGEGQ